MIHRASIAAGAALLFAFCGAPVTAQDSGTAASGHRRPRVPVTVALQDTTNAEPGFRILRRAAETPFDVIILTGRADAVTLSEAVFNLMIARRAQGDTAKRSGAVRVRRNRDPLHGEGMARFPWAERVVNDLRRAQTREISGVGTVRAVEIWLPPQHGYRASTGQSGVLVGSGH